MFELTGNTPLSDLDELYHHGIEGMKWGRRRFQNEDGTLTEAGKKRYSDSLSSVYDNDDNDDYVVKKGTTMARRTDSGNGNRFSNDKYAFTYDYDNDRDDGFYKQFGTKVTEYTLADDAKFAGKQALGKAFVNKMIKSADNYTEDDLDNLDILYEESTKRSGEKYVEGLFAMPFNPSQHTETLEKIGGDMIARMVGAQRNDAADEKAKRRGYRHTDTFWNDVGGEIVDDLINSGYSGMRDYHDINSSARTNTSTIIFNPNQKLSDLEQWLDD